MIRDGGDAERLRMVGRGGTGIELMLLWSPVLAGQIHKEVEKAAME